MTLKEILLCHARKYPEMMPTDAVKLIYQNEFGPGHLILDKEKALAYLMQEYRSNEQTDSALYEAIGNGLIRIHLQAIDKYHLDIRALFEAFCKSAEAVKGSFESFEEKLAVLKELANNGVFKFTADELSDYLSEYKKAGYPMVSHSKIYKQNYHPSYRIVTKELFDKYFKEEI